MTTTITFGYEPINVHLPFHSSAAKMKLMFGAVGSGKSYALCSEGIAACLEQPGLRALLGRKFTTNLRDTTETVFFDVLPSELFKAGKPSRIGGHFESFTFPNGSVMLFRGMEDWRVHKSLNLGWMGLDEADELDEDTLIGMNTRIRQRDLTREAKALGYTHQISRQQVCLAANPAGRNWLWKIFVNDATKWPNTEWFRSTSFDNPYLGSAFMDTLMTMPHPWIKRYVLCQFDDFAGQIYPTWAPDTHIIRASESYPGAIFFMGHDPGISTVSPTAALYVVNDRANRRLIAIAEYMESDRAIKEHCEAFRALEGKMRIPSLRWKVSDPAIESRDFGTNTTRRDIYAQHGYSFDLGAKTHALRIPALAELIHNRRFVATERCPMLSEQIQNYRWADLTPGQRNQGLMVSEKVRKGNDHIVDCAQYLAGRNLAPAAYTPDEVAPEGLSPEEEARFEKEEFAKQVRENIRNAQMARRRAAYQRAPGVIR